jgi:hypothetical protein
LPEQTLSLLINGGIAGIFAVFAIVLVREFIKFIREMNDSWQEFLKAEREQREKIMVTANRNMTELSTQIARLTAIIAGLEKKER